MDGQRLARMHGAANLLGGLWPLLHLESFEAVFGPKVDRWLVRTVSGLLIVNGLTQLATGQNSRSISQARLLGIGTAGVLAAIDFSYAPRGRISKMYLLDALVEVGWIVAWLRARPSTDSRRR
jgi:hypothetical protein